MKQELPYKVSRQYFKAALLGLATINEVNRQFALDCERKYFESQDELEFEKSVSSQLRAEVNLVRTENARQADHIIYLKTLIPEKVKKSTNLK